MTMTMNPDLPTAPMPPDPAPMPATGSSTSVTASLSSSSPAPASPPDAAPTPVTSAPVPALGAVVRRTYDDPYVETGITTVYGIVVAHGEDAGGPLLSIAWLPELSTAMRPDDLDH